MSKHTLAPWKVIEAHRGYIIEATDYAYDVAVVRTAGNHDNEANAQLIAAAPDLLEALKALLEAVDDVSDDFGWPLATDKARAAIDKAEGKA